MIDIRSLSCQFGAVRALDAVSLSMQAGRCHALLGSNGAGKTTLLRVLAGIAEPTGGDVAVDGQPVDAFIAARRAFYLPEHFRPPAWMRGRDFLASMHRLVGLSDDTAALHDTLRTLDFDPAALARPMAGYSKGMTQKLGLACALRCLRPLLLLDEPMSGLDPRARIGLSRLLRDRAAAGGTVVLSVHSLTEAVHLAHHLWVFARGTVRFAGTPDELASRCSPPDALQAYLDLTASATAEQPA